MSILILISVYVASIFLVRWVHRSLYKLDYWIPTEKGIDIEWFIPIINTAIGLLGIFVVLDVYLKNVVFKHSITKLFFNRDLIKKKK